MELLKDQASACGPGCGCHASGSVGKVRWIVGVFVLVVAGVLVARAVVKTNGAATTPASAEYAAPIAPAQAPTAEAKPSDVLKEIGAFSELNTVAIDTAGVFVVLPGKSETDARVPVAQVLGAARTIGPKIQGKIGTFTLKTGSPDYIQVAAQVTVPSVLALVKGRGMVPVSGEITEAKLVQAYVAASSAGGCGPASGGCGPSGCK